MAQSIFSRWSVRIVSLVILFSVALIIRLYDLTDLPLDFHPTRQLLSMIKARGLYYETQPDGIPTWQLETGIHQAKLKGTMEPSILEHLVAFTYRFTGEQFWIARIYSSTFWLIGGIFLYLLVCRLVSHEGALVATAYYLLFPYAIIASRSFQPDPLMVTLTIIFWWMFSRWTQFHTWINTLLAGLLGGLAILVKFPAAFFVIGGALGFALNRFTFRDLIRNAQIWVMAVLGALPGIIYLLYGTFIAGFLGGEFSGNFIPALLISPVNYLQWEVKASMAAGGIFTMLGLLGFFLTKDRKLIHFILGLWGGYLLFGMYFNYHIATHDYYHLPLIPIVAVSLAPLGDAVLAHLSEATVQRWMRSAVYIVLIYGMFSVVWDVRNQMKSVDYRPQAAMWAEISNRLGRDARVVALTQDYGSRLQYWGLMTAAVWPYVGDIEYESERGGKFSFDGLFDKYLANRDYFLVTDFDEFDRHPGLEQKLYSNYQVLAKGDGYIIFNLRAGLNS